MSATDSLRPRSASSSARPRATNRSAAPAITELHRLNKIDIILPLAIADTYTYRVPDTIPVPQTGMRVLVPLGKSKLITGIVLGAHDAPVDNRIRLRDIVSVLDEQPVVTSGQLRLWRWMADYYMCTLGEVMAAALPSGIIDDDYRARTVSYLRLADGVDLQQALDSLRRAPRQQQTLMHYLHLARFDQTGQAADIERRLLVEAAGNATLVRQLIERRLLIETEQPAPRIPPYMGTVEPAHPLTPDQQRAAEQINDAWRDHRVTLLHGVTSSGKTEVYIHLIQQQLQQGCSVLYLVPEIALTAQLTERLQRVFGDRLAVFHSRFSDDERVEIYRGLLDADRPRVIIGARSALFLPLHRLGLVIVDEEHETSYKQQSPAPRYHARSAAIMLAEQQDAHVLLGTATPSIESWYNATIGKYALVTMNTRYAGLSLPHIRIIDLERQYHRKEMYGHFSDPLVERIREVLADGKQVILFQNRRGYAPRMECTQCHRPPLCVNCDVPLTQHRAQGRLTCHYCGYSIPAPPRCPQCGGPLRAHGFGTERLEEEVATLFPAARVARMDLDTTRSKNAYRTLINDFAQHKTDILIGTQMVTKGLHFDHVSLVAVLQADNLLNQPDFRSYERAFQMLEQVSGRAGRKGQQGEVIIQTFDPQNDIFRWLQHHDYAAMAVAQREERRLFRYPPFYRLINLSLRHHNSGRLETGAECLHSLLVTAFGSRCSGVIIPAVPRVQNAYLLEIRLRIEATASYAKAKRLLGEQLARFASLPEGKGVTVLADIDPL
ncbi:MAG: primosomal protein N' [Paludibacteraceae bacterium]|nr:primosomal protein N' [Paludibacteraceae bacterium]